jgi:hypothetical protein
VRLYFCIALLALLLYLMLWRPFVKHQKFPLISCLLVIGMLGIFGVPEIQWLSSEHQASLAVAAISGNPKGKLVCQRFSEAFFDPNVSIAGYVDWDQPDVAVLKWAQCEQLFKWMNSDKKNPTAEEMSAVHVLTHESVHVSGNRDEASTECTAVSKDSAMAQFLGASRAQGNHIATFYFENIWPHMPADYQLAGCSLPNYQ